MWDSLPWAQAGGLLRGDAQESITPVILQDVAPGKETPLSNSGPNGRGLRRKKQMVSNGLKPKYEASFSPSLKKGRKCQH